MTIFQVMLVMPSDRERERASVGFGLCLYTILVLVGDFENLENNYGFYGFCYFGFLSALYGF